MHLVENYFEKYTYKKKNAYICIYAFYLNIYLKKQVELQDHFLLQILNKKPNWKTVNIKNAIICIYAKMHIYNIIRATLG